MSLTANAENRKPLRFFPAHAWPKNLPAVCWKSLVLTPNHPVQELWDLSQGPLAEALLAVYPTLSFSEFLRLNKELKFHGFDFEQRRALAGVYKQGLTAEMEQLSELTLPKEFWAWCDARGLHFGDLRPLLRSSIENLEPAFKHLAQLSPTKNQGVEILELLADLDSYPLNEDLETWLKELKALSHPLTTKKDQTRADLVKRWAWPSHTKGNWIRVGDQAGLSIHMQAFSPEDLEKKLNALKTIGGEWKNTL